jgi:hypothetical protein
MITRKKINKQRRAQLELWTKAGAAIAGMSLIPSLANTAMSFKKGTTAETLFLSDAGYVGIGTTNPQAALHVLGDAGIRNGSKTRIYMATAPGANDDFGFARSAAYPDSGLFYNENTPDRIAFAANAGGITNPVMMVTDSAVGLGVVAPAQKLVIKATDQNTIKLIGSTAGNHSGLIFADNAGSTKSYAWRDDNYACTALGPGSTTNSLLVFDSGTTAIATGGVPPVPPGAKLEVNGQIRVGASTYFNVLSWSYHSETTALTNGIKIKTRMAFLHGSQMPTIHIEGYDNTAQSPIRLTIVWYVYDSGAGPQFLSYKVASGSEWNPPVTLSNENGYVCITLGVKPKSCRLFVRTFGQGRTVDDNPVSFIGWTVADEVAAGAPQVSVPYAKIYVAGWNDLAEYRPLRPGAVRAPGKVYVATHAGATLATKRRQRGTMGICSDTYGMALGGTPQDKDKLPIAISGWVLADVDKPYPMGTALIAKSNGQLTKAYWWEKVLFRERLVGTLDTQPQEYNGIAVNGRHWVKIK